MTTRSRCAICKQEVYRNASGKVLMHTRTEYDGLSRPRAEVCEGSDKGARP